MVHRSTDKDNFLYPLGRQCLYFRHDILNFPAAEFPPNEWNSTKGTPVVAALGNLHISRMLGRSRYPGNRSIINLFIPLYDQPIAL